MADVMNKIEQAVFDCFNLSSEIVLQGRNANLAPRFPLRTNPHPSNNEFCAQVLSPWRDRITKPMCLDIYVICGDMLVLMERWNFSYQRRDDIKQGFFLFCFL